MTTTEQKKPARRWRQDPGRVQEDILTIATELFAAKGFSGTRVDEITAKTQTSKRMIYYYFTDKERLYARVLERAYARVREAESELDLRGLPATEALTRLVEFTYDHHSRNPDFIRLVMIENVHHAEHLTASDSIAKVSRSAIDQLAGIVAQGQSEGVFRPDLDPLALHWMISALSFFNVSNRPSFSAVYGPDLFTAQGQAHLRRDVVSVILAFARKEPK